MSPKPTRLFRESKDFASTLEEYLGRKPISHSSSEVLKINPMPFTYDIFISYAHLDNRSPFGDERGWIDLLHERLAVLVAQALGSEVSIWRDGHSLQRHDDLQGAIDDGVTRSLLLVPIISPRYVQSHWCKLEIDAFQACPRPLQSGAPAFRSGIFKVIKTPLPQHLKNHEPEQIRNMLGYPFFAEDKSDGKMHEFSSDAKDKAYWKMLNRLVSDISKALIDLKYSTDSSPAGNATPNVVLAASGATPKGADTTGNAKFVYLAETTSDLSKERELVSDELLQRGYSVVPEQKLPLDSREILVETVRAQLARCDLSVHLIGARYGSTPEDDARSMVRIQEELATERAASNQAFLRLLWMPPGLTTASMPINDDRQKSFVTELQGRISPGAELLWTSVEDLKTRIVEKLQPPAKATKRPKHKQVYIICENRDRGLVRPIKQYLFQQDLEVITWLDEGATDTLMDYHRKNLRECDAALVYFGSGDEPWVRKNLEDLEKAFGYGRESDWLANAVYIGAPPSEQKEDFDTHLVPYVIRNTSSFDPNDLRDFVGAVRAAEGGLQ